jgi:hypothetical protein
VILVCGRTPDLPGGGLTVRIILADLGWFARLEVRPSVVCLPGRCGSWRAGAAGVYTGWLVSVSGDGSLPLARRCLL